MPATVTPEQVETTSSTPCPSSAPTATRSAATTFEDLDVDSLDLAELSQIVDEEFGVQLKGSDVAKIKTVGDALDLIVGRAS